MLLSSYPGYAQSNFLERTIAVQTQLIGKLTGEIPIDESGGRLGARSTPAERNAAAHFLRASFEELGLDSKFHSYKLSNVNFFVDLLFAPFRGKNVYATIPATIDTDEYIILGAHYDSEAGTTGAIDNATGVALHYGIAKELLNVPNRTKNVLIVFFDQEEDDEIGSKAFARKIQREEWNVHSLHISDLIGWDADGDKAVEIALASQTMEELYYRKANELGIPIQNTRVSSSDHKSFIDVGYQALLVSEAYVGRDTTPYLHTEKDNYETVNFEYLATSTQLVFEVIKGLIQQ